MRKRFKAKKKKKFSYLLTLLVIIIIVYLFIYSLGSMKLKSSNEDFILNLLYNSNHYKKYEKKDILSKMCNYVLNIDLSKPLSLAVNTLKYEEEIVSFKGNPYVEDPIKDVINNPRVYIYNSHQEETYSKEGYIENGITPSVMMASYLLKDNLNKLGIPTTALEGNIIDFMKTNSYTHDYSYIASRYFIEEEIKENNFDLIIDLHRDSLKKEGSTININGVDTAKILFVVGLENPNYQKNLVLTEKIENIVKEKYPGLSRGIYKKKGAGVDGVYNQDLNPNMILLEVGGYQNTIGEVTNTTKLMAEVIKTYLENIWKKKI